MEWPVQSANPLLVWGSTSLGAARLRFLVENSSHFSVPKASAKKLASCHAASNDARDPFGAKDDWADLEATTGIEKLMG